MFFCRGIVQYYYCMVTRRSHTHGQVHRQQECGDARLSFTLRRRIRFCTLCVYYESRSGTWKRYSEICL